jgi:phage baseplate assembly protein W
LSSTSDEPCGIDADTGRPLAGWPWVVQSIHRILGTVFFERVMRPHVGSNARRLIGELANLRNAQRFRAAIVIACLSWVPNFRPTRVGFTAVDRKGEALWVLEGWYLPRAHLDPADETGAEYRSVALDLTRSTG